MTETSLTHAHTYMSVLHMYRSQVPGTYMSFVHTCHSYIYIHVQYMEIHVHGALEVGRKEGNVYTHV